MHEIQGKGSSRSPANKGSQCAKRKAGKAHSDNASGKGNSGEKELSQADGAAPKWTVFRKEECKTRNERREEKTGIYPGAKLHSVWPATTIEAALKRAASKKALTSRLMSWPATTGASIGREAHNGAITTCPE
jgi:hypothetical protein